MLGNRQTTRTRGEWREAPRNATVNSFWTPVPPLGSTLELAEPVAVDADAFLTVQYVKLVTEQPRRSSRAGSREQQKRVNRAWFRA